MNNIAVFASGTGTNFRAIFRNIQVGEIPARICCFLTNRPQAGALAFAQENHIPSYVISPAEFHSEQAFGEALLQVLGKHKTEWIVLAGYLKKIPDNVVEAFSNRILNIHPALLPAFGGKGMYGMHVHRAVYEAGVTVSGATIHLVNQEYDAGPIVMQRAVDIDGCRSPEEIAARVLKVEHQLYSQALRKVLTTPFRVEGRRVIFSDA